jgi:putative copper export protein
MTDPTSNPYEAPKADLNPHAVPPGDSGSLEDALAGRYDFQIGDVMREAWAMTSGMKGTFWGGAVLLFLGYMGVAAAGALLFKSSETLSRIFNLALSACGPVLFLGLVTMGLRRAAGLPIAFETAFGSFDLAKPALVAGLLTSLLTYLGFRLILPGIYLAISYCMTMPLIVDRKFGPWRAMETSRKVITKRWFQYFGLLFVLGLVVFVSAIPWATNVVGVAYRRTFGVAQTA